MTPPEIAGLRTPAPPATWTEHIAYCEQRAKACRSIGKLSAATMWEAEAARGVQLQAREMDAQADREEKALRAVDGERVVLETAARAISSAL